MNFLIVVSAFLAVSYSGYRLAEYFLLNYKRDGKKYLALLRNPAIWDDSSVDTNPYPAWGNLVYCLNKGGNLKEDIDDTYENAAFLGSTREELWQIHRSVHKWSAELILERLIKHETTVDLEDFKFWFLDRADCSFEDIGTTREEMERLIREVMIVSARERVQKYLETNDPRFLMAAASDLKDVPDVELSELGTFDENTGFMIAMALGVIRKEPIKYNSN